MTEGRILRRAGLILVLALTGCRWGTTDLSKIEADPIAYQARSLTVQGTVNWSGYLPEVGIGGFELEQGGARLLVLSERPAPPPGSKLKVSGLLEAEFDLGPQTAPVLLDEDPGPKGNGGASDVR